MKLKLIPLLLITATLILLVGCGGDVAPPAQTAISTPAQVTPTPTVSLARTNTPTASITQSRLVDQIRQLSGGTPTSASEGIQEPLIPNTVRSATEVAVGASEIARPYVFQPNLDLLISDSDANRVKYGLPCGGKPPCLVIFTRGTKQLIFVGSQHTVDRRSPSHRLIDVAFSEYDPQAVIIEGWAASESHPSDTEAARRCGDYFHNCPEQIYGLHLAYQNQVPFVGGEPTMIAKYEAVIEAGFTDQEYFYLRSLSAVDTMINREDMSIEGNELVESFNDRLERFSGIMPDGYLESSPFDQFKLIYHEIRGSEFEWSNNVTSRPDWMRPTARTLIGRMLLPMFFARESTLIETQAHFLNDVNRVLVIYGSGHLFTESRQHDEWFQGNHEIIYPDIDS